jgi:hypothetical protein
LRTEITRIKYCDTNHAFYVLPDTGKSSLSSLRFKFDSTLSLRNSWCVYFNSFRLCSYKSIALFLFANSNTYANAPERASVPRPFERTLLTGPADRPHSSSLYGIYMFSKKNRETLSPPNTDCHGRLHRTTRPSAAFSAADATRRGQQKPADRLALLPDRYSLVKRETAAAKPPLPPQPRGLDAWSTSAFNASWPIDHLSCSRSSPGAPQERGPSLAGPRPGVGAAGRCQAAPPSSGAG